MRVSFSVMSCKILTQARNRIHSLAFSVRPERLMTKFQPEIAKLILLTDYSEHVAGVHCNQ